MKAGIDKLLKRSSTFEQEKLIPSQTKYNDSYLKLYELYEKEGYTLEQFDSNWDSIKKDVEWYVSYKADYERALRGELLYYEEMMNKYSNKVASRISASKHFEQWNEIVDDYSNYYNNYLQFKRLGRITVTDSVELTKSILSQYRTLGVEDIKTITKHLNNSRSPMRKVVEEAYQLYPKEWVNNSISYGNLTPKKVDRGYYSHWLGEIAISGDTGTSSLETAIHELGHRYERTQNLLELEKALYDKRTSGETVQWLGGGYSKSEVSKFDNWLNKYIGKDYGGSAYEICSMGFEYAYTNPKLLLEDEEFADFILGILTLL